MENASKALIMAGAVLIAILLISLAVYMFNQAKDDVVEMSNLDEQEMEAFNKKITPYLGQGIQGSQVNDLIQKVISINTKAISEGDTARRISITFPTKKIEDDGNTYNVTMNIIEVDGKETINYNVSGTTRKVDTTKYYNVSAQYTSGLLRTITVTEQT